MIELLAVVAIVALLMALLMPALQQARRRAYQAACLSNLRQIGVAFQAYAGANGSTIPQTGNTLGSLYGTPGEAWYHWLGKAGYLGSMEMYTRKGGGRNTRWKVLRCPAEYITPRADPRMANLTYFDDERAVSSYSINWSVSRYWYYLWYCWCWPRPDCCSPYPFRKLRTPADGRMDNATLVMDCEDWWWGGEELPCYAWHVDWPDGLVSGGVTYYFYSNNYRYAFRHMRQANVVYLDGHADSRFHAAYGGGGKNIYTDIWGVDPP